jgi:class III poly(R)-hydroxyalkanoic acid synthase PhaE subunit
MEKETAAWTGMADQLVNTWTEVGTQMWKSWADLMGLATRNPIANAKPGMDSITQRFVDNQQLLIRLLQLSFNSWQEILPKIESGENWQQFLTNYNEQVRKQLNEFSSSTLKVSQDATELWQLYLNQTQKFGQLWAKSLGASIAPFNQASLSGGTQPWIELSNLYWNLLYEESFGSLMQSPLLGPAREFNGKLLRSYDAWINLYRASIDYQVVLANVQVQSFEELMRELISLAEKGEPVKDWRKFQQLWGQVADGVFEKAFCQEENLKVRGRFVNSLNAYRMHQRRLMEVWMQAMDIPLRSEVDEVHKTIYELRKEVKSLKKTLARYEAQAQIQSILPIQPQVSMPTNGQTPPEAEAPASEPLVTVQSESPAAQSEISSPETSASEPKRTRKNLGKSTPE